MLMRNIFVLTGPVRSGKTTALWKAFAHLKNVGGVLTPDDPNGVRQFYDLAGKTFLPFELPAQSPSPAVEVGRFKFSAATFETGHELLTQTTNPALFIVDEVGKLEVERESGWEPALTPLIEDYKAARRQGMLLLVVRETLVAAAVERWQLAPVFVSSAELESLAKEMAR